MNKALAGFAREQIKKNIVICSEGAICLFKRMYSHDNLDREINEVVDNMPDEDLDVAMMQVQNSLSKIESKKEELAKC